MKLSHCLPALALATTCLFTGMAKAQVIAADTIYSGGDIVTINDDQPSVEAVAVKLEKVVPFALESTLRARGARFVEAPNFEKKVAVSERLVTGQNPASATGVAEAVVRLLEDRAE